MKTYLKCYGYRLYQIALSLLSIIAALIICALLFGSKLKKVSGQLNTYAHSDYSVLYLLNYDIDINNSCVYPDTDIYIFRDEERSQRIGVSVVMSKPDAKYDLEYLHEMSQLSPHQISLSANTAQKYSLKIGDTVFMETPYSATLSKATVVSVTDYEYDYCNPSIANDIGVAFIGTDLDYIENVNSKYLLFANESQSERLSKSPQIINDIINKSSNSMMVFQQGIAALFFCLLLTVGIVIVSHMAFFSKSLAILRRLYLKGMRKKTVLSVVLCEKVTFLLLPVAFVECIIAFWIPPNSTITIIYHLIPFLVALFYCIISLLSLKIKLNKGGD